jgi:hypothetical protein
LGGFCVNGQIWHNWLIGGVSYVECAGAGARLGLETEMVNSRFVVSAQYKYPTSDIYGARVDIFSVYFSILSRNLF